MAIYDLDDFLIDLAKTDSDIFKGLKEDMDCEEARETFIIAMEIPTHSSFSKFMFYDVMVTLCRHAC
jgi:hypothetical protein